MDYRDEPAPLLQEPDVVSLLKQQNVLIRTLIAKTCSVEGEQYSASKNISHKFFVEAC
jgi:hypothetical protein